MHMGECTCDTPRQANLFAVVCVSACACVCEHSRDKGWCEESAGRSKKVEQGKREVGADSCCILGL